MSNTLVVYYSRRGENYVNGRIVDLSVGNTAVVAEMVQAASGANAFELEPAAPYPSAYDEAIEVARTELRTQARPALAGLPEGIGGYDIVFVGYPNWWGTAPMPVFTFLEAFDFSGKTIVPFCTHEGSGMGASARDIARACPGARVLDGLAVRGGGVRGAEKEVRRWVEGLGLAL